jgi:hypothetical protein
MESAPACVSSQFDRTLHWEGAPTIQVAFSLRDGKIGTSSSKRAPDQNIQIISNALFSWKDLSDSTTPDSQRIYEILLGMLGDVIGIQEPGQDSGARSLKSGSNELARPRLIHLLGPFQRRFTCLPSPSISFLVTFIL